VTWSVEQLRPRLFGVAYRMLGSVADAEDVVQEALIRWMDFDHTAIREPEAYLRKVVTRLCLDQLKSARHRRESYVGTWLPEPILDAEPEAVEDVTLPFLMALERLSPLERAAFLLHDVFGVGFEEIAQTIRRDPAACRQLASRARSHVRAAKPRFDLPREHGLELAAAFFSATRSGDLQSLRTMLAEDVTLYSDGGGKASSVLRPIRGIEAVMKLSAGLARLFAKTMSRLVRAGTINGMPGFVTREGDVLQTTALQIAEGRIVAIYVVRNPEKLEHVKRMLPD